MPGARPVIVSDLPLHCKSTGRLNQVALSALPSGSAATAANWAHAVEWLRNMGRYAGVPRRDAASAPQARLSHADVRLMLERGVIARVDPARVLGHVFVFAVPELFKMRRRPIKEPRDINATLGKDTLMQLDMATKADIIALLHRGCSAVAFDFASYFDQFELSEEIGCLQCFRKGREFFRLSSGAMGQRQMVEVAHTATRKLADVVGRESHTAAIIDNVIFVGDRGAVLRDAVKFVDRVRAVGGTLNENVDSPEHIASAISSEIEWGGIALDFERKTTRLTAKVLDKVALSWGRRACWTFRNVYAHYGLLFWALGILEVCPGDHFAALQFFSRMCASVAAQIDQGIDTALDVPAVVWPTAMAALERWTAEVMRNEPRTHVRRDDVTWRLCSDACATGWGYVAVNDETGEVRAHGAEWDRNFARAHAAELHRSTFTEPEAVVRACCHLLARTGRHQRVVVACDNAPTVYNFARGYTAGSFAQNSARARLRRLFPAAEFTFEFVHVPGAENVHADHLSRFGAAGYIDPRSNQIASEMAGRIARDVVRATGGV